MELLIIISGAILLALFIAIIDYYWYGRKIIGEIPLKKRDIIAFYFSRTMGELLAFTIGAMFMYLLLT